MCCGGSGGTFSATDNRIILDSVTHADSALFFGFGSTDHGAAARHFSQNSITSRYRSRALSLLSLRIGSHYSSLLCCGCNNISDSCSGPAINELIAVGPTATRGLCSDVPYFQNLSQRKYDQTFIKGVSQHGSHRPFHYICIYLTFVSDL